MAEKSVGHSDERYGGDNMVPARLSDLRITPLIEPDVEAAARLYTRVFLSDEPTSRCHQLNPDLFLTYARFYVRILVRKRLSLLAWDGLSRDPAGFVFCFDLRDDPGDEGPMMEAFLNHFRYTVAMIDELERCHLHPETVMPGEGLHIFQIGVDRNNRSRGIATALIHRALENGRNRGYRFAVADCTHARSKKTFERCGFSERGFSSYESFAMDGVFFFSGLDGGISLMVRDISG